MKFKILKLVLFAMVLMHGSVQASAWQMTGNHISSAVAKSKVSLIKGAKVVLFGITVGAAACGLTGCEDGADPVSVQEPKQEETIRLGFSHTAELFQSSRKGAELAVQQINNWGGIDGMMVELYVRDVGRTPDQAKTEVSSLINADGVHALIGPEFSTQSVEVSPLAHKAMIPMLTTASTNPAVTAGGNYVFMTAFTDEFQGRVMAELAANELNAWTAGIITQAGDVYSEGLADTFTEHFMALEGSVIVRDSYGFGDVDFGPQLERVAAANPDVLFVPGFTPEAPHVVKQAREMGITAIALGADGWFGGDLLAEGGEALNGSYFSDHFSADATAGLTEETVAFISAYQNMYGESPDALAALAYDAVHLMALAIDDANSRAGDAVRDSLAATQNYSGATLISHFDENNHAHKAAVVNKIVNGEITLHGLVNPQ